MDDDHHFLLPLSEKLKFIQKKEDEELKRMQMILDIADETVKDVVERGTTRAAHFEDLQKASATSRNVGLSDNKVHLGDDVAASGNILFSNHLSDPLPIAKTEFDEALKNAVVALRGVARDSLSSSAISSVHQKVAPLRSALSVALKEREPGNLRMLSQHSNPKTQQRLKNLKAATILFETLGKMQREQLEPIEKKLTDSEFILPFHHPFVVVANHIRNELLVHETGDNIEAEFDGFFTAIDRELQQTRRDLDPEQRPDQSIPSGKECFVALETERAERGELHDHCILLLEEAREIERKGRDFLAPTTKRVRKEAHAALDHVLSKAENVRTLTHSAREQLEQSQAVREQECEVKIKEASERIVQLEERARINRNKQEKAVRRMREEIKSLVKLQTEHRQVVEEIGQQHTKRVINEVTLEGVRLACSARSEKLQRAETACDHSTGIGVLVNKQLETAINECQAHISRVTSQEFSRCARLAQKTVSNCCNWYRSLGDLLAIRTQRMDKIHQRTEQGGWQAQFLQQHEKDSQDDAIVELVDARKLIEKVYVPLSRSVLALEVDCPTLKYFDSNHPETQRMRQVFLDAPDAGRDRMLREGAKEAAETLSMMRSRRGESVRMRNERDFMEHSVARDGENGNAERSTMLRSMLIGSSISSPVLNASKRGGDGNNNSKRHIETIDRSSSITSSHNLPSISSPRNPTVTILSSSSSQIPSASLDAFSLRLPSLTNSANNHKNNHNKINNKDADDECGNDDMIFQQQRGMGENLISVSAVPKPPRQGGAPEPPPRRR